MKVGIYVEPHYDYRGLRASGGLCLPRKPLFQAVQCCSVCPCCQPDGDTMPPCLLFAPALPVLYLCFAPALPMLCLPKIPSTSSAAIALSALCSYAVRPDACLCYTLQPALNSLTVARAVIYPGCGCGLLWDVQGYINVIIPYLGRSAIVEAVRRAVERHGWQFNRTCLA